MFDEKCSNLAEAFIEDDETLGQRSPEEKADLIRKLAQEIQDTIEDFIEMEVNPPEGYSIDEGEEDEEKEGA